MSEHTEKDLDFALEERPRAGTPFDQVLLKRRTLLQAAAAIGATTLSAQALGYNPLLQAVSDGRLGDNLFFDPIEGSSLDQIVLPPNYSENVIIRWGDSLFSDVPDLTNDDILSGALLAPGAGELQAQRFGYNNDAVEFYPLPEGQSAGFFGGRGLMAVNHEYTNDDLIFINYPSQEDGESDEAFFARYVQFITSNPETTNVGLACHGIAVVEVERNDDGTWSYIKDSSFNRRYTGESPMEISGPAAGHPLLQTADDPTGTQVLGTLNNCAAGQTPYGTYLSAEENFDQYFANFGVYAASADADPKVVSFHQRVAPSSGPTFRGWEHNDPRFDVAQNPNEPFRFGWVVEVDPYDPNFVPKKRTALGRFKHECATTIEAKTGQLVVYSGDDARMEYLYKFVTEAKVTGDRLTDRDMLDSGTLYVARLNPDGSGEWLAVDYDSQEVLQAEFEDQAEVLINTRRAADLLGATPMDRPEDVEANPLTKRVYMACTNNTRRDADPDAVRDFQGRELSQNPDAANPRAPNRWGHIVEIQEEGDDNAATTFRWDIFLMGGNPQDTSSTFLTTLDEMSAAPLEQDVTYYAGFSEASEVSPIGSPDNISFDSLGNLWIVTDGSQPTGTNNGTFAVPTFGENRGKLRQFMSGPRDCEVCGAEFVPDDSAILFAIQHPGDGGPVESPTSYWPDGELADVDNPAAEPIVPRPSVIAVYKNKGVKRIGS